MKMNFGKLRHLLCFVVVFFCAFTNVPALARNIDAIIDDLRAREPDLRMSAVTELGAVKEERAIQALLSVVFSRHEDWKIKIKAIRSLGEIPDPEISEALVTVFNTPVLNEECPAIKWNTAHALGQPFNRGTRAVVALIAAIDHHELSIREAAIQALGKIRDPWAVPKIILALRDRHFAIRASAIAALEEIGDPAAVPFLKEAAADEDDKLLQMRAFSAIRTFQREDGSPMQQRSGEVPASLRGDPPLQQGIKM
jgi:HEAT repeat protein